MPSIRIAVAGATGSETTFDSNLGGEIVQNLLQNGAKVILLARHQKVNAEKVAQLRAAGAEVATIDYSDPRSLDSALEGVDVVISTVSGAGFANQAALAEAAKRSGSVKLFLPSEWGTNTLQEEESSKLWAKRSLQLKLQELGVPYLLIFHTLLIEVVPHFIAPKDGKIALPGGGNVPVSTTAKKDVAAYVGYILTHVPLEKLQNRHLPVEASRPTFRDLAKEYQKRDPSLELEDVPLEVYEKRAEAGSFLDYLIVKVHRNEAGGDGSLAEVETMRSLHTEWQPKVYTEFLQPA